MFYYLYQEKTKGEHLAIFKWVNKICIKWNNTGGVIYCLINLFQSSSEYKENISEMRAIKHFCSLYAGSQ